MDRPERFERRTRPETPAAHRWVREVSPLDDPRWCAVGTGELLPDGAVVLREDDIDRMGIRSLRRWLTARSLRPRHPIALVRRAAPLARTMPDDLE
jgi:hypothetical protein